ncbi:unnamed protein product [Brassicogethes aeneus]|uniref:Uncharacterized protein n=1 Tax=Brassicogethes aeneus TaxID=1431903 RepID=A0A9P0B5B7_BRAAE|nr:unnamed protein product [Brassicogethes aeneus]
MIKWCVVLIWMLQQSSSYNLNVRTINGTYEDNIILEVNSTTEFVVIFPSVDNTNPFRVITRAENAKKFYPVLVMVRQATQVTSWQLPTILDTTQKEKHLLFYNVSRTMCHDDMDSIAQHIENASSALKVLQSFIVAISTSDTNVVVHLKVVEEKEFYVKLNKEYSLMISPSEPKYVYFSYARDVSDTVIIEVDSEDDVCFTVSVQDSACPVLVTNKDITYEGYYQTVSTKGALIIKKTNFKYGFFLVFVAKPDNYDCGQEKSILPIPRTYKMALGNRTSSLTFNIKNSINDGDYTQASVITVLFLGIFGFAIFMMTVAFYKWGTLSKIHLEKVEKIDSANGDLLKPQSANRIDYLLNLDNLKLNALAQHPKIDKRRSFNYLWHICSIALFYSIPVVQLVVTYQRVANKTGNQDMCYYNFMCAHPKFGFSDFNHIYSNVGYVFMGIVFILSSIHRQMKVPLRLQIGIPVHYGLFYAMGMALIIEGLLSACYHICPSQSNYQFDTSFMYVMSVLIMVKLYQNRHPDINASAYATFTMLGFTVFLEGFRKFKNDIVKQGFTKKTFEPVKKVRFILLLLVNLLNYVMLISGLLMYHSGITDFGTFLLGLLMGNSIIHAMFYTFMKLIHKEKLCIEALIYGLLGCATWAAATVFFLDAATLWTVTPAESRQWNQGCILMNFYDKHDVWHLLSAPAMFFSFMFLLCLDDDLVNTKQSDIEVF